MTTSKHILSLFSMITLSLSPPISAEIVLDGTLGGPTGPLPGPDFAIEAHLGQHKGNNLFHSFATFNLNAGESATFKGPNNIENIISRVTGGQPSYINGTFVSQIPANMYFLNPAGVMFGEQARLNVQGSFHVSTADYLRLGTDGLFSATHPENTLLTIAPPSAFGFLDATPAPISKQQSVLEVREGKTLSFIGGDLTIEDNHLTGQENSTLNAPDGQINLVSVASDGEVPVVPAEMSANAFARFGTIKITDVLLTEDNYRRNANIDVSGTGGGNIYIRGGQIFMENVYVWADTHGDKNGQGITITATDDFVAKRARITSEVIEGSTGNGGNINVVSRKVTLTDRAQIVTSTQSSGNSGNITMTVEETIVISGFFDLPDGKVSSGLLTKTSGMGNAGNISLEVDKLTLIEGAQIDLNADNDLATHTGHAGTLTITAKDSILISGEVENEQSSALTSNTRTNGNGGTIIVSALQLTVENNATIQAGTEIGTGQGGQISLDVDRLFLRQGGTITTESRFQGNAGNMLLEVGQLDIRQGGTISAESEAQGQAGHIVLHINDWLKIQEGFIKTETSIADGGNISITSPGYLYLIDGEITTSVRAEEGDGGNITLNPEFIVLDNHFIKANAFQGNGGNIRIASTGIYHFTGEPIEKVITASSEFGIDGVITIHSPDIDISDDLLVLPKTLFDLSGLLNNRCAGFTREKLSRFVITIRDVLPPGPEDLKTHYLF
jgi:filamentous hemagglutinin family protein